MVKLRIVLNIFDPANNHTPDFEIFVESIFGMEMEFCKCTGVFPGVESLAIMPLVVVDTIASLLTVPTWNPRRQPYIQIGTATVYVPEST
jgi:hypothetical protein